MTSLLVIDSDILIGVARKDQVAITFLNQQQANDTLAISAVTQLEMLVGARSKVHMQAIDVSLNAFHILDITPEITQAAVRLIKEYRFSHGLALADALIAATVIAHDIPLATRNQRDFHYINDLNLLPYP